jgi:1-acyl-sn-glycerol-3-phosphate acyltransferase
MSEQLARLRRVFFVGLAFVVFGVGGIGIRIILFPLVNLCVRDPQTCSALARDFIGWSFRCLVGFLRAFGVLDYKIVGAEKLERRGLLILANHPTLLDIVFLMAFVRRADCIVKSGLWRNPFMRGPVKAAGYIRNDHGVGLLDACIAAIGRGENLVIFPEGTRTSSDGAIKLKRGAAHIAVRSACRVTPELIRCAPPMLVKWNRWWRLPAKRVRYRFEVRDDIDVQGVVGGADSKALAARRLTDHLQEFFKKETERHGFA